MSRAMFEYTKTVLNKVSFDTNLFCKEVQKALHRLLPYEIEELKLFIQNLVTSNPVLMFVAVVTVKESPSQI